MSVPPAPTTAPVTVRAISLDEHRAHVSALTSASFLQTPAWGLVKREWQHESLGWFSGETQVGSALVLYRTLPKIGRSLAYLPEGPLLDWSTDRLDELLDPMVTHLRGRGAFGVRMGPPVVVRRWSGAALKAGIADPAVHSLADLAPDHRDPVGARVVSQLADRGWRRQVAEGGFAAGQPAYVFQVPLTGPGGPLTEAEVLAGMNQLWRRNIKKADKAGVEVSRLDGTSALDELKAFHDLYAHTAERDHFTPRPLSYFTTMIDALGGEGVAVGEPDRITLWSARHQGDLVAATIAIRVGTHAWYSYGASSTEKREARGSNAVQWEMIRAALAAGASTYDLRGITDTLDAEDSHVGLVQFKVGTGGEAVELAGEWDLPLNKLLYKVFELYLARRAKPAPTAQAAG